MPCSIRQRYRRRGALRRSGCHVATERLPSAVPTSLVGSYAAAGLADRPGAARATACRRACARRSCGGSPEYLEQAQDDATLLAIRDQERAGLDIITDGEMRRESYSNRFATALDGVDIDNPGHGASTAAAIPNPVPRVVGPIRRKHPVRGARRGVPAREHQPADQDHRARPVHDVAAGAERLLRRPRRSWRWTTPPRSTRRSTTCSPPGADIVQIDEPYMQARPEKAREFGVRGDRPGARGGRAARPRCTSASATRRSSTSGRRLLVPGGAGRPARADQISIETGAVGPRSRRCCEAAGQDDHPRRARSGRPRGRDARDGGGAHPARAAVRAAGRADRRARLRNEVPAARRRPSASSSRLAAAPRSSGRGLRAAACEPESGARQRTPLKLAIERLTGAPRHHQPADREPRAVVPVRHVLRTGRCPRGRVPRGLRRRRSTARPARSGGSPRNASLHVPRCCRRDRAQRPGCSERKVTRSRASRARPTGPPRPP